MEMVLVENLPDDEMLRLARGALGDFRLPHFARPITGLDFDVLELERLAHFIPAIFHAHEETPRTAANPCAPTRTIQPPRP